MEAATGDKDFWIVDVVGNFCFVHPAKAGISSNLNRADWTLTRAVNIVRMYPRGGAK